MSLHKNVTLSYFACIIAISELVYVFIHLLLRRQRLRECTGRATGDRVRGELQAVLLLWPPPPPPPALAATNSRSSRSVAAAVKSERGLPLIGRAYKGGAVEPDVVALCGVA